jgi:hypothetical protein
MIYYSKNKIWFEKYSARFTLYNKFNVIWYQALKKKLPSCELTFFLANELKSWTYDDDDK